MEFRVLSYFMAVAREKNISKAAKSLHLSQPTLSKQLKGLENELGVVLFERGNREIKLTDDGIFLYNQGKNILSLVDKTTSNLKQGKELTGDLYIGAGETRVMKLIAHTLKKLLQNHPAIKLHFYSGNADDVMDKLNNGVLDFGIVINPTDKRLYHSIVLPEKDRWGLLIHKHHALSQKKKILSDDLIDHPLFVSRQSLVDDQITEWLGGNNDYLSIVGNYNLLYNASLMVEAEIGSALCLEGILQDSSTLKFIPLYPNLYSSLSVIWKKDHPLSSVAQSFLEELRNRNDS